MRHQKHAIIWRGSTRRVGTLRLSASPARRGLGKVRWLCSLPANCGAAISVSGLWRWTPVARLLAARSWVIVFGCRNWLVIPMYLSAVWQAGAAWLGWQLLPEMWCGRWMRLAFSL